MTAEQVMVLPVPRGLGDSQCLEIARLGGGEAIDEGPAAAVGRGVEVEQWRGRQRCGMMSRSRRIGLRAPTESGMTGPGMCVSPIVHRDEPK